MFDSYSLPLIKLNHNTETSTVAETKGSAIFKVSKLGAAGYAYILLVVVNISVFQSLTSQSHQRQG